MKTQAQHNAKIAQTMALFQCDKFSDDENKMDVTRVGKSYFKVRRKNAATIAARIKSAHRTFPAGAYKRAGSGREYPRFFAGMTTFEYIVKFQSLNNNIGAHVLPIDYDRIGMRAAATYENGALDFDVIEEVNEDYFAESATQDVAQVVAQAVANIAIIEAMAETRELATCEAGENEAQSVTMSAANSVRAVESGNTGGFTRGAPMAPPAEFLSEPTPTVTEFLPEKPPIEYTISKARYCKDKVAVSTPSSDGYKTRAARLAGTFGRYSMRAGGYVMSQGQADKFARLYAEGWDASIMGEGVKSREAPNPPEQATQVSDPAPSLIDEFWTAQVSRVYSKSGNWSAWFFKTSCGDAALGFSKLGGDVEVSSYATASERMQALQAMARAADAPDDTPPTGGLPDAASAAPMPPVAQFTQTPSVAVSSAAHGLQVGDVVRSSWGYDQTNVDHFQIVKVIGKRTVEVRELAEHDESDGAMSMTGRKTPIPGEFVGEVMRRSVDKWGAVNILKAKYGRAYKIEPLAVVHGVRCYPASSYSSYA